MLDAFQEINFKIPSNVSRIISKLQQLGGVSLVVGGAVRDLMRNAVVNDYDLVTTQDFNKIIQIFPYARTNFSARKGLAWKEDEIQFEITNFKCRAIIPDDTCSRKTVDIKKMLTSDAKERDFTINALYLNIEESVIVDPLGGLSDIKKSLIRCVTPVQSNLRSQPLHMLRAIRFAHKLKFEIDSELQKAIGQNVHHILQESPGRVLVEIFRQVISGYAMECLSEICHYGFHMYTFPNMKTQLANKEYNLIQFFLQSVDHGFIDRNSCTRDLVFAVLIWEDVLRKLEDKKKWEPSLIRDALQTALFGSEKNLSVGKILFRSLQSIMLPQAREERRTAKLNASYTPLLNFSLLRGAGQAAGLNC